MHFDSKWRTITLLILTMTHKKRSFQLFYYNTGVHSPKGEVENHAHIHTSRPQNRVAKTLVHWFVLSSVVYPTFSGIVISLTLDKIHEKKLQVNNNSFTDCHTEGLITKANYLWLFHICLKSAQSFVIDRISFVHSDTIIKKGCNFYLWNLSCSVFCGSETWYT